MSALVLLRTTTTPGDLVYLAVLLGCGLVVALVPEAADHEGIRDAMLVCGIALIMIRYQYASGRPAMFWFDAARQHVPGIHRVALRAEMLRAALFVGAPAVPALAAGGDGIAMAAAGVTGLAVGLFSAVMPYRFALPCMVTMPALLLYLGRGSPSADALMMLTGAAALLLASMAYVAHRLRGLLRRGSDPEPGGDYAFVFSFGRHAGSVFSAPNSAPFTVMREARHLTARAAVLPRGVDARVRGLLGEYAWQAGVAPARHWSKWAVQLLAWPLLMTAFFLGMHLFRAEETNVPDLLRLTLIGLAALWGLASALGAHHHMFSSPIRRMREAAASGEAEILLIPTVVANSRMWAGRLRPLWLAPALAVSGILLLSAMLAGVPSAGMALVVAWSIGLLVNARLNVHAPMSGARGVDEGLIATTVFAGVMASGGLPLLVAGLHPAIDGLMAHLLDWLGIEAITLALVTTLPYAAALALTAWMARRHRAPLWVRDAAPV